MAGRRSSLATFSAAFGFFFGGAALGLATAYLCAPNSAFLSVVSFLVFPLSMFLGFPAWLGSAFLAFVFNWAGRTKDDPPRRTGHLIPPGSWVFVPVTVGLFLPVSFLAGFLTERVSFSTAVTIYLVIGGLYGIGMWRSAKTGWLPFPEET